MPLPVRSLPVVQNWDCHACSNCCRTYHVSVTAAEKARIDAQGWDADPDLKDVERIVYDRKTGGHRLNHRPGGACVFLGPENRCRIHARFGPAAKPMACRFFPFVLVPAGDHWRVGIRFACPSAADNKGRPLDRHAVELREYVGLLEADAAMPAVTAAPAPLQPGQAADWPDTLRFVGAILAFVSGDEPIEWKLRTVLALSALCRQAKFDKVTGAKLNEFLGLVAPAVAEEVPPAAAVLRPGWVGRTMFRQVVALYARKDIGQDRGEMADRGVFGRAVAAWRFARGTGRIPKLHGLFPETTFAAAEQPAGPLSAEAEKLLTRYYQVKVESLQFFGPSNYRLAFWDGLDSLVLTFPAMMWLARVLAPGIRDRDEAVRLALRIVDDNFGFNPLFGTGRQLWGLRVMNVKNELPRLVAWYGR
jgi:lysine-N-methylase